MHIKNSPSHAGGAVLHLQIIRVLLRLAAIRRCAGVAAQYIAAAFSGLFLHHMGRVRLLMTAVGSLLFFSWFLHGDHPFETGVLPVVV